MKKYNFVKKLLIVGVVATVFASCQKEDSLGESRLDTNEEFRTELDQWLFDEFTAENKFNINVSYKWDPTKADNSRWLYPADPIKVKPAMNVVRKIWIDSYNELGGESFVRNISPKEIHLIGSPNMNKEGTQTLGLADQGNRIVLFIINSLNITNASQVKNFVHTIQHEYIHILNQKNQYNIEKYAAITRSGYNSNWQNYNDIESREEGFISAYSRSNADEDFAEMAAAMLVDINAYNAIIDNVKSAESKKALKEKEAIIVDYFKRSFKIDFYELCAITDRKTKEVIAGNFN